MNIFNNLGSIFNASLIYATFRASTPIIYASLCASLTQQANILNVGTEGIMLVGAFAAVAASYLSGSRILGIIVAMLAGALIALIMAVGHLKFNSDITAIGMGINLFALAITKFLLQAMFNTNGTFASPDIASIPRINLAFLKPIPIIGAVFSNMSLTEWLIIPFIILLNFYIYKTPQGLRLRSVGQNEIAAESAGINTTKIKYKALIVAGMIGGLAGAHLSLGYSNQFVENMTNNRGFMGIAAMFFGGANPVNTSLGCLLFGFADSVGGRLQSFGLPAQFVLLMPYVVTVIVLAISMGVKIKGQKTKESSLVDNKI